MIIAGVTGDERLSMMLLFMFLALNSTVTNEENNEEMCYLVYKKRVS